MTDAQIIQADALTALAKMPNESVQCVVTSPPYWGLRDYNVPGQLGLAPILAQPDMVNKTLINIIQGAPVSAHSW